MKKTLILLAVLLAAVLIHTQTVTAGNLLITPYTPHPATIMTYQEECTGVYTYYVNTVVMTTETFVYDPLIAMPPITYTIVGFKHISGYYVYSCDQYSEVLLYQYVNTLSIQPFKRLALVRTPV